MTQVTYIPLLRFNLNLTNLLMNIIVEGLGFSCKSIMSQKTILKDCGQGSHDAAQQSSEPYDGTQFLFHHVKDDGLGLGHFHVIDALLNDTADVNVLQDAWQVLGDDDTVGVQDAALDLCNLLFVTRHEVAHGHAHQLV